MTRSIRVRVQYLAPYIRDLVGVVEEVVELAEGSTIGDLVARLAELHGGHLLTQLLDDSLRNLRAGVVVLVNDTVVQSLDHGVGDGDTVSILIALDGG
ncbi:MAG: MoaD/ThiS family protein [Desulfurococcaceae archaeon]|nr:MoaD/ThiS family protein [Desulfurococcaceae archaeon]